MLWILFNKRETSPQMFDSATNKSSNRTRESEQVNRRPFSLSRQSALAEFLRLTGLKWQGTYSYAFHHKTDVADSWEVCWLVNCVDCFNMAWYLKQRRVMGMRRWFIFAGFPKQWGPDAILMEKQTLLTVSLARMRPFPQSHSITVPCCMADLWPWPAGLLLHAPWRGFLPCPSPYWPPCRGIWPEPILAKDFCSFTVPLAEVFPVHSFTNSSSRLFILLPIHIFTDPLAEDFPSLIPL